MVPRSLALATSDFNVLRGGATPAQIERHFSSWISDLYEFLNADPNLSQIQRIRGKRPLAPAFEGRARYAPEHWYTYHRGGRSEAQFNIGMFWSHLRFGIGFEPTGGGFGDAEAIRVAQQRFADALRQRPEGPEEFCAKNHLEVEVNAANGLGVSIKDVNYFLDVVDGRRPEERWIFLGRLLRADADQAILQDSAALAEEMERVFAAMWPLWLATRAHT